MAALLSRMRFSVSSPVVSPDKVPIALVKRPTLLPALQAGYRRKTTAPMAEAMGSVLPALQAGLGRINLVAMVSNRYRSSI